MLALVTGALERGAKLVVTPELALSGFAFATPDEMRPYAQPATGPVGGTLARVGRQYNATIVAGFAELGNDGQLYNTAAVATGDGSLLTVRAPRYGHNYGWMTGFGKDSGQLRAVTPLGPLRVALCAGLLSLSDGPPARLIAVPAAWNDDPSDRCLPLWQSIARQRCAALIIANRYGRETYSVGADGDFSRAISCIIDSEGRVLARSLPEQHDEILYAGLPESPIPLRPE